MSQNKNVNTQQAAIKAMQQKPKFDLKQYGMLIALAVKFGTTRLIDNILIGVK